MTIRDCCSDLAEGSFVYSGSFLIRSHISNDSVNTRDLITQREYEIGLAVIGSSFSVQLSYVMLRITKVVMTTHILLIRKFKCYRRPSAELLKKLYVLT